MLFLMLGLNRCISLLPCVGVTSPFSLLHAVLCFINGIDVAPNALVKCFLFCSSFFPCFALRQEAPFNRNQILGIQYAYSMRDIGMISVKHSVHIVNCSKTLLSLAERPTA